MAGSIGIMIDLRPQPMEDTNILTFGACVSAGPIKDNGNNWPPVDWAVETDPLKRFSPYKPWDWNWADDNELAKPPAEKIGWSVWVRHSAKPATWHRLDSALIESIDSTAGLPPSLQSGPNQPSVYAGLLNQELVKQDLLLDDGGGFRDTAQSSNFKLLWEGNDHLEERHLPTSDDSTPDPGFNSDRLMTALARWSISRPPLNFAARLAWAINLKKAKLDEYLSSLLLPPQNWPDTLREHIEFAAVPFRGDQTPAIASIGNDLASAVLPAWNPLAAPGLELHIACNNAIALDGTVTTTAVEPELNNWRRLMVTRLARFFALPEVILELASEPHKSDEKLLRWHEWSATETLSDRAIVLRNLWIWIVASSADIFTASVLGGRASWWWQCTKTDPPPLALFTAKRATSLEWITWLKAVTKPPTATLPKTELPVPVNGQWQALFDLVAMAEERLKPPPPPPEKDPFVALLTVDISGRAELNLMTEFLHNLQVPEVLRLLLPELWMEAGVSKPDVAKLMDPDGVTMLGGKAPDESIQPALAVARVRAHWHHLFQDAVLENGVDDLVERLDSADGTDGIVIGNLYKPRLEQSSSDRVLHPVALPNLGTEFAKALGQLPGQKTAAVAWIAGDMAKAIAEPHGITLPLAAEEAEIEDHKIESDDGLQQNAGFLIFAKEVVANKWRCLTQAKPVDRGGQDLGTVLAVPVDLGFQDGRLACTVTYNNQPLVAVSPVDELVRTSSNRGDYLAAGTWERPLIRYEMPGRDGTLNIGLIPGLVYGRRYEFAALPLRNSGLLPLKLQNDHPASLDFTRLADPTFAWSAVRDAITYNEKAYLRRVGIGAPRVMNWTVDPPLPPTLPRSSWPQIPAGVLPLAAEIRLPNQDDILTAESEEPVALLFSPQILKSLRAEKRSPKTVKTLTLDINKPASDLENWDRWVAKDLADDAGKRTRSEVWGRVCEERDDETKPNQTTSPDDPAVGDYLLLQLERLHAPPNTAEPSKLLHAVKYRPSTGLTFQSESIKVRLIAVDNEGALEITGTEDTVAVSVPEGQVWRVTLHNLVAAKFLAKGADPRLDALVFDHAVLATAFKDWTRQGHPDVVNHIDDWFACSSHTFRIETVSDALPLEKELWDALIPAQSGDQIQLSLDYSKVTKQTLSYVSSMDIRHQIWRWNGRPAETVRVPPPGAKTAAAPDDEYAPWDGIGFHDREDSQHRLITQRLTYRPVSADLPQILIFTDDRSGDDRALYSRFGLTAYSRYYSITEKSVTARRLIGGTPAKVFDAWRRHLMPARLSHPLKRPLIRAMLPITSSENLATVNPLLNRASSPGVMLLLAEPFYQQAGIVEQLECEVMTGTVKEPDSSGAIYEHDYLQAGFDPVISKRKLGGSYGLSLVSVASPAGLIEKAESLLIVALVGGDLHIRIFDGQGQIIIDKSEADLVPGPALTSLKEIVKTTPFPDVAKFSSDKRRGTVDNALSVVGHEPNKHLLELDPPVGLTFDVGATDPHIVSSCFFGRVPEGFHPGFAEGSVRTGATAANTFFKVHARRVIRPRMEPGESSAETEAREALASEWTESEWVRLLPDASALLLAWPAGVDGSRSVVLESGALNISGWNDPLPWPAEHADDFLPKRFSYGLLVSRLLPDTSGRLREIYQCALQGDGDGNFAIYAHEKALSVSGDEETVLIRIIELFHREPLPPKSDLWERLFPIEPEQPDDPREDAGARIERMSSPFRVKLTKHK